MRHLAHSTRSTGTGSGDRACALQASVSADTAISGIADRHVVIVVSPDVALERVLGALQFEITGHIAVDAAVAQQHDARGKVPDIAGYVRGEEQRASLAAQLARAAKQDPRRDGIEVG